MYTQSETTTLSPDYIQSHRITVDESTPEAVLAKSIHGCNIGYNKATDIKEMFEFTCNLNLALFGNKLPDDDFYFNA